MEKWRSGGGEEWRRGGGEEVGSGGVEEGGVGTVDLVEMNKPNVEEEKQKQISAESGPEDVIARLGNSGSQCLSIVCLQNSKS